MKYKFWLHQMPFLNSRKKIALLKKEEDMEILYHMDEKEMQKGLLLTQKEIEKIKEYKKSFLPEREWEILYQKGIQFTCYGEEKYPNRLKNIPNPPYGITYYGKLPKEEEKTVSIIGARNCSAYGVHAARQFAKAFAENKISVVSGMALGIDGIGQKEAIDCEGTSYGVLGCGVDICYPKQNRQLYELLKERGGVLSEYPLQTEPKPYLFPPRNRIISGLSDVILVIEAKEKSGTLITVDMALEQGKEVYVVPGRITDTLSRGCNRLLRQGAGIACSPKEFLEEILEERQLIENGKEKEKSLDEKEKIIYRTLDFMPKTIQQIYEIANENKKNKISMQELLQFLTMLELKGMIGRQNGCYCLLENYLLT